MAKGVAENEPSGPSALLIRAHYGEQGCFDWNRDRFIRLCEAWGETPREMGERAGLTTVRLNRCMSGLPFNFSPSEGILLQFHHNFIRYVQTGYQPKTTLFPIA